MRPIHQFASFRQALLPLLAAGMLACWADRQAAAASLLLDPPSGWNGLAISGRIVAGWKEHGGPGVASSEATSFLIAGPTDPPLVPGQILTGDPLALSILPGAGDPKDRAEVSLAYGVTVGTPSVDSFDRFRFNIDATTSATTARYDFGAGLVPADAFVFVDVQMMSAAPMPAATLAALELPGLPSLTAGDPHVEALGVAAEIGPFGVPTTTWTMAPGDGPLTVPFVLEDVSDVFVYMLRYELLTPYGSDPTVSISLEGGAARVVPEPSGVVMIGCVAAAWSLRRLLHT